MRVQLEDWTVRGPDGLYLSELPGPRYSVVLIYFPVGMARSKNYIDSLMDVLATGKISLHNDKSKRRKLTKEQVEWLNEVKLLANRVFKVDTK